MSIDPVADPALLALSNGLSSKQSTSTQSLSPAPEPVRTASAIKRRTHTSLNEKLMIIDYIKQNPTLDQISVAKHFQTLGFPTLSQSTISRYLKDEEKYRSIALQDPTKPKKQKRTQFPQVALCLEFWYYQRLSKGPNATLQISENELRNQWKTFEELLAIRRKRKLTISSTWFETFQEKPKRLTYPIEARSSIPPNVAYEIQRITHITDQYDISDILAMDEICLAYACPPCTDQNIVADQPKLTLVFTCSADGSWKDIPSIVGTLPQAQAYPQDENETECGFNYYFNKKAVMTFQVWEKYLTDLDEKCRERDRKVLLLVDTAAVHLLPSPPFDNLRIEYINTSSIAGFSALNPPAQPFIAGITRCFKSEYRIRLLRPKSYKTLGIA